LLRIFLLISFLLWSGKALAWQPLLSADPHAPEHLFVVDKKDQFFLVFSNKSPLTKIHAWQCSTGEVHGDKQEEGDLKTPEGVYFIEHKRTTNLDFEMYGDMALTLDYPNPVDRIRGKTGHGIWIHGRGGEVIPFDTEGCVVMDMKYMRKLEQMISLQQTPVIITSSANWDSKENQERRSCEIAALTREWARAWSDKSDSYFEFYHPEKFAQSRDQPFSRFKKNKLRIFASYEWMDVYIDQPKVLAGPGYWVSFFGQVFNSPGYYSLGVKRLYWQEDEQGRLRITGEEWRDIHDPELEKRYETARRKAQTSSGSLSDHEAQR